MSVSASSISNDETATPSYQRLNISSDDDDDDNHHHRAPNSVAAKSVVRNFKLMSILFSLNHGCVVACLALATPQLGATGAWQSGILYITYTSSALIGATYVVKQLGARDALYVGMGLYCVYVGCFVLALIWPASKHVVALLGGAIGGVGAGFLWTAQGSYFARCSELHANFLQQSESTSTASLAGTFAFFYLAIEVVVRLLSTFLLELGGTSWEIIFGIYTTIAIGSTLGMRLLVQDFGVSQASTTNEESDSWWYKLTAASQLLFKDPKMKYMIGLNSTFGLVAAFLNSYVNSQVLAVALGDTDSRYVGMFSSWVSALAAGMSLVFGKVAPKSGKGPILILGTLCFFFEVFLFVLIPDLRRWGWILVTLVYSLHAVGRSTFEGTLKATFADFFPNEKEGAFANINLQNGLSGAIGYIMSFSLVCPQQSRYCVEYTDGSLHNVGKFERTIIYSAVFAIVGYWRASTLHQQNTRSSRRLSDSTSSSSDGEQEQDRSLA